MPTQHPAWRDYKVRSFATASLDTAEIEARVLNVCKAFDKVGKSEDKVESTFIFRFRSQQTS